MRRNRAKGNPDFRSGTRIPAIRVTCICLPGIRVSCVCVSKARVTEQGRNPAQQTLIGTAPIRRQRDEPAKQQREPGLWHVGPA
jgi:hypothetical protein